MNNEHFFDLGVNFYEWYKKGKVKFVYGTESKNLDEEIVRISKLIEYVKIKRNNLFKGYK